METPIRSFPWRYEADPYRVAVSELLLQRTTSTHALRVYEEFVERYPTAPELASAGEEELARLLYPLGLAKRARLMRGASVYLTERHAGTVPEDYEELLKVPGVGRYTARAVLCFGYGLAEAPVDVNVARVVCRVFGYVPEKRRIHLDDGVAERARRTISRRPQSARRLNYALLDVGALHCRATPKCGACPLNEVCALGSGIRTDPLRPEGEQGVRAGRRRPERP